MEIVDKLSFEVLDGIDGLQIKQFGLKLTEEVLHDCVIQAVALAAHALADIVIGQQMLVVLLLVLPSMIGMHYGFCPRGKNGDGFLNHGGNHGEDGTVGDHVSHQIGRMKIENRQKIYLLPE